MPYLPQTTPGQDEMSPSSPVSDAKALTTGEAARCCAVSVATIQNWIHRRGLRAHRTAGGQYRILPSDLREFMSRHGMVPGRLGRPDGRRYYCWQYFSGSTQGLPEPCRACVAYRSRALKCYALRSHPGHPCLHCPDDCSACTYYELLTQCTKLPRGRPSRVAGPHHSEKSFPMSQKILVIDDELDSIKYLTAVLKDNGYEVAACQSGQEGLELAVRMRPALVLLDIMMPGTSGISVYRMLRENPELRSVPVILVSGIRTEAEFDYRELSEEDDIPVPDAYLEKPIDVGQFLTTVERLLGQAASATAP